MYQGLGVSVISVDPNPANIQLQNVPPFQPSGNPNTPLMSPIAGMTQADYNALQADLGLLPGPAAGPSAFDVSGGFVGPLANAPGQITTDYSWLWWIGGGLAALFVLSGHKR